MGPFSKHSGRMISRKELIPASAMSAKESGPTKFGDTSSTSQSPQSSIPQSNNEIWINGKYFISKSVQLRLKLPLDIPGGEQCRV
jgi:hypothetical protein